jgi:16S rRNA (guanine1207-N2)-methyltransferase
VSFSPSHYFSHHAPKTDFTPHWIEATARNRTLKLATGAGVFAKRGLDEGTRLLLEAAQLEGATRIGDLGCGWGAVGCFVAHEYSNAQIYACDINVRATQLAQLNLQSNKLENAAVWCGDGFSAVCDNFFDAILFNPPVRAGNGVIQKLFDDAHRTLKSGGKIWIVLRTAQGAKSWAKKLEAQFGNCETVAIESGYRVLVCVR